MKLFYKKQNLISELKKLKSIKASDDFKAFLFERLNFENERFIPVEIEEYYFKQRPFFKKIFFRKTAPLFMPLSAIIIIIVFIGAGAGITLASQSALPGEILYPFKIVSEKARVILAVNDNEKARLHFEFSSKRLDEVAELAKDSVSDPKLAKIAVESYKKELSEGQAVLFFPQNEEKIERAANVLADITSKNKEAIANIGKETKNYKMVDSLKDAWENTVEYNDKAALITLSRSTSSSIVDLAMQKKVSNKIAEAEKKIAEIDKYLLRKEEKGVDIFEAKIKIVYAKELLGEAKNSLEQTRYESAFNKAKEAYKAAIDAQKIVERINDMNDKDDEDEDDEDKLEMFKIYYIPENATTSESHSFNSTTSAVFNQPASIIRQINKIGKNSKKGDKENIHEGNNWQEKKRKKSED